MVQCCTHGDGCINSFLPSEHKHPDSHVTDDINHEKLMLKATRDITDRPTDEMFTSNMDFSVNEASALSGFYILYASDRLL